LEDSATRLEKDAKKRLPPQIKPFGLAILAVLIITSVPGVSLGLRPNWAGEPQTLKPPAPNNTVSEDTSLTGFVENPAGLASSTQTQNVELVGHIGGATNAVWVRGSYAFLGEGPSLSILDISDPSSPSRVGKTAPVSAPTQSHSDSVCVKEIVVKEDYAYLAAGGAGLVVVDISDPADPVLVGRLNRSVRGVDVAGDYAYLADAYGLGIIDISDPTAPTEIGSYHNPGEGYDNVAIHRNYAHLVDGYGLHIVDVSDPTAPAEIGFYGSGWTQAVAVEDDYVYLAHGRGLSIIDVSDPTAPTEMGFYGTSSWTDVVAVAGSYAYIIAGYPRQLLVLDVSDPAVPMELGLWRGPGNGSCVALAGDYAYVTLEDGGLWVVDVSNPSNPTEMGSYSVPGDARDIALARNHLYVANDYGGLRGVDASVPSAMVEVGAKYWGYVSVGQVAVVDDYAYVGDDHRFWIFDISEPTSPQRAGHCRASTPYLDEMIVLGEYAYLCNGWPEARLSIVDVSNPDVPSEIGSHDIPPWSTCDVAVAGNYAYLAHAYGLSIIDVSDPTAPTEIGFYGPSDWNDTVAVAGGYAYTAGRDGLHIIDVSDPTAPTAIGFHHNPEWGFGDVAIDRSHAYLVDGHGLHIVDVSDPTAPNEIGFYKTSGGADVVAVEDDYAHVVDRSGGLLVLRLLRDKVRRSIPTTGGGLSSSSGDTSILVPRDTLTETVILTYRHLWGDRDTGALAGIDHRFDLTAIYSDTDQLARLTPGSFYTATITYTTSGPAIEDTLALYGWDEDANEWTQKGVTSDVDASENVVTAQVDHFSRFAVLGETQRFYLPLIACRH